MSNSITIPKKLLFQLMHSHTRLAQAEYHRNPAYNDSHFSAQAEHALVVLHPNVIDEYFNYVTKEVQG